MKFDTLSYTSLFEKSLVRIISEFNSDMIPSEVIRTLNKAIKIKVSNQNPSEYNIKITRSDDGVYHIESSFMRYRDSRLLIINLLSWIERNGNTDKRNNFYIDLKFEDEIKGPFKGTLFNTGTTIEKIDKLKFILEFNEDFAYKTFPSRRYHFTSKSIKKFSINQKFIPKSESITNPKFYTIPETSTSGINFETLNQGYLRLQYIGGENYEKKPNEILEILSEFCVRSWDCTERPGFTQENLKTFSNIVASQNKIRESYQDYKLFSKNYPNIKFMVNLVDNPKTLDTYYITLKDRIFDFLSNIEYKGSFELNYDSNLGVLQVKDANFKGNSLKNIEFISCKIEFGNYELCDFYNCELKDAFLNTCNLFHDSILDRCKMYNCMCNRTTEVNNCEIVGENSLLNTDMKGGIFRSGKIGKFGKVDPDVKVIQYTLTHPGFFVAGEKVIIPTKKYALI